MSPAVKPPAVGPSGATDASPAAMAAAKLGMIDKLLAAVDKQPHLTKARDIEGRTCLHYAAGYGHEECVERLLEKRFDSLIQDNSGDNALHLAAIYGCPMSCFNLTKAAPAACLARNLKQQRPAQVAKACERGEVLNAMLLACSGDASKTAVEAMDYLLQEGAVPDTWAPNGSSALMLAASVDGVAAIHLLLKHGATIELQDALGRSALMFAAGNCAAAALLALLGAGATLGLRDRRSRSVLDYAPEDSQVKQLLLDRLKQLEAAAEQLQAALLAELDTKPAGVTASTAVKKKAKAKKAKKKQAAAPMAEATLPRQATDLHVSISQRSNKEHSLSPTAQHMKDSSASEEVSCIRPTTIEGNGLVLTTAQSRLSTADADHTEHSGHSTATSSPSPSGKCDTSPTSLTLAAVPQLPASSGTTGAFQLSSSASGIRTSGDSELGSLSSKQEQEIAVLSLIAGVAADAAAATVVSAPTAEAGSAAAENAVAVSAVQADSSAAALAYTAEADSAAPTGADVAGAVEATTSSDSWDDSISASDNILHALRSDAGVPDQWQVVKAGRKAPSHPGKASERHSDSSADQGSMLTGAEAACVASKLLRRSSSSASASSWESVSGVHDGPDRFSSRPGCVFSTRTSKPTTQHVNRSGPALLHRAPPPPPPGPPPSQAAAASAAATHWSSSQATESSSVSVRRASSSAGNEPKSNAWDQPLAGVAQHAQRGHSSMQPQPSSSQASAGITPNGVRPDEGTPVANTCSSKHMQTSAAPSASGSDGQQRAEAAPLAVQSSTPSQCSGDAAQKASEQSCLQREHLVEPVHQQHIDELQAEVAALRGDVAQLFLALKAAETRHAQELAGVIVDAAQHQTKAVAEAIAKERMSIAAFLKAACNQAGQQRPSANGLDHRALNHQSGQRRRHSLDQHEERNGIRSRFGNQNSNQNGHQGGNVNGFQKAPHVAHQGLLQSAEAGGPSSRGWDAEIAGGPRLGSLLGSADHPAATHPDELREGFRRAVGEMPLRTQSQNEIGRVESSISSFFPRVASWGNLSTHSSGSGAGLYNEPMSRGLPTFEPLTTPAGIFSSNKSSDKAGFPSYLASIWSDDKTPNGSPNNHFEQPSLLSNSS